MENKNELLSLTKKLISLPTISENVEENSKALYWIMEYMNIHKNHMRYYKDTSHPSLVISTQPLQKHFDVILHGHIDVVPAEAEKFIPVEKNGKLYGRGACDMKGGLAAMMLLMKSLIEQKTKQNIGLLITTDEELGGYHGVKYLLENMNYSANFFITGEGSPTNSITTKSKGMIRLALKSHGISNHGARVWTGENAIDKLMSVYQEIKSLFASNLEDKNNWYSTVNASIIKGGEAINMIPKYAELDLDIRFTEEWGSGDEILKAIDAIIEKYDKVSYTCFLNDPMLLTDNQDKYVQKLANSLKKYVKDTEELFISTHGTSDARFASWKGTPAVEFGPVGKNSHHNDEYIEIENLLSYYDILNNFLLSLS